MKKPPKYTKIFDEFDRKILYELEKDGRASISQVAKTIKKSVSFVQYRLHKLEQQGILIDHIMIVDRSKLGFKTYRIYLRIVNHHQTKAVIDYLRQKPEVYTLQKILGKFQLYLSLYARDVQFLEDFIVDLVKRFDQVIVGYRRMLVYRAYSFAHNILFEDWPQLHHDVQLSASEEMPLTEKEKKVLDILSIDPRMSFTQLAEQLHSERGTARRIYAQLIQKKVIAVIRPSLELHRLGYVHKHAMIKLRFGGLRRLHEMEKYLHHVRQIKSISKTFGNYDFICRLIFKDLEAFRQFEEDLYEKLGDTIDHVDYHDYLEEIKYAPSPGKQPTKPKSL